MAQGIHSSFKPSLLTKTEIDWLLGKAHLSQSYEYKIKSIIKSKLKALYEFELPLILESGLFPEAADLAMFKDHNEATSKTSLDYSSLSIKEDEEKAWAGFGDGNLNSDNAHAALVRQRSRVQIPAKASLRPQILIWKQTIF
ncbi:MAG TPA: hypothetical protein VE244_06100 [Nitrososphaeraceae archaeon]|nr:hypothetical protein [Nitrososphaeraceae archaeon]